ncbi:unnamed protein product [Linum tenue]|uniref:LOB domain-containing protein n=1 Tax=Linum tenue TaxID=586396 RepID=A0AAV0M8J4_9ROSI|nr:unnamed protein product [Linum tenue]
MSSNQGNRRCAGCKYLRRRCPKDCLLAPYFPPNNPQRFESVHKVFGASNVARLLQQVAEDRRAEAADCMAYEASLRVSNPVYGCAGMVYQLQEEIMKVQLEIQDVKGKIALHNAGHSFLPALQQQQEEHKEKERIVGVAAGNVYHDHVGLQQGAYNLGGTEEEDGLLWPGLVTGKI